MEITDLYPTNKPPFLWFHSHIQTTLLGGSFSACFDITLIHKETSHELLNRCQIAGFAAGGDIRPATAKPAAILVKTEMSD